jgi:uncharacterized iron-regulated membrane protein
MRSLIRPLMFVHRWTGLIAGVAVVWLALTGAGIVFRPSLDAALYPRLERVRPCAELQPVDAILRAATTSYPGSKPTYIYLYGDAGASAMIRFADTQQVYVDGCTGRVLGRQARYGGVLGTLEGLHKARFLRDAAMPVIGWTALLLAVVLVGGGLVMWWPRRRAASVPKPQLRKRARSVNLHVSIGLYASAVVFVLAITALPLSLGWVRSALFHGTASIDQTEDGPMPALIADRARGRMTLARAWSIARSVFPGPLWWGSLRLPKHGQPLEVGVVLADAPHGEARSYVYLDPQTGAIVAMRPYATLDLGSKLYYWALAIHTGRAGGTAARVLMFAAMLALAFVTYAGAESFARSFTRKRKSESLL